MQVIRCPAWRAVLWAKVIKDIYININLYILLISNCKESLGKLNIKQQYFIYRLFFYGRYPYYLYHDFLGKFRPQNFDITQKDKFHYLKVLGAECNYRFNRTVL